MLDNATRQIAYRRPHRPRLLPALLLLDAFVVGGLVALFLVQRLLETIMYRLVSASAQAEILNVLDQLLAYWVVYVGAAFLLCRVTLAVYALSKTR